MTSQKIKDDAGDTMTLIPVDDYYISNFPVPWNVAENFKTIPSWKSRDDDVILVAYPKSGNLLKKFISVLFFVFYHELTCRVCAYLCLVNFILPNGLLFNPTSAIGKSSLFEDVQYVQVVYMLYNCDAPNCFIIKLSGYLTIFRKHKFKFSFGTNIFIFLSGTSTDKILMFLKDPVSF